MLLWLILSEFSFSLYTWTKFRQQSTSTTIEGHVYVINSFLLRMKTFDDNFLILHFLIQFISVWRGHRSIKTQHFLFYIQQKLTQIFHSKSKTSLLKLHKKKKKRKFIKNFYLLTKWISQGTQIVHLPSNSMVKDKKKTDQ